MDIYAAGAVLYEMVTGEKPMEAPDRSVEDALKRPSEFGVEIEEQMERVILKALALEPKLRFQAAGQMKEAIISRKKVELPEEEIKKYQKKKKMLAAGMAAAFAVAGGMFLLSQTYFSGRGKIDVAKLPEQDLEIWISSEDASAGEGLSEVLLESVEKECPQLNVTVQVVDERDYGEKIQQAAKDGELPDVFCTDGIQASDYCADLSKLLNTMELSGYLHLDGLGRKGVYELPTAMQVAVVYINEEKEAELPESLEQDSLPGQGELLGYAEDVESFAAFQDMDLSVSRIAGDLSDMDLIKEVTVDVIPPTDFAVVPILKDGNLIGTMERPYGVSKAGSRSRQEAGMFLLSLLLSDGAQSAAYMGNEEGIPLNRTVLSNYQETKMTTYLDFLKGFDLEKAELYEGGSICRILQEEAGASKEK